MSLGGQETGWDWVNGNLRLPYTVINTTVGIDHI